MFFCTSIEEARKHSGAWTSAWSRYWSKDFILLSIWSKRSWLGSNGGIWKIDWGRIEEKPLEQKWCGRERRRRSVRLRNRRRRRIWRYGLAECSSRRAEPTPVLLPPPSASRSSTASPATRSTSAPRPPSVTFATFLPFSFGWCTLAKRSTMGMFGQGSWRRRCRRRRGSTRSTWSYHTRTERGRRRRSSTPQASRTSRSCFWRKTPPRAPSACSICARPTRQRKPPSRSPPLASRWIVLVPR